MCIMFHLIKKKMLFNYKNVKQILHLIPHVFKNLITNEKVLNK